MATNFAPRFGQEFALFRGFYPLRYDPEPQTLCQGHDGLSYGGIVRISEYVPHERLIDF